MLFSELESRLISFLAKRFTSLKSLLPRAPEFSIAMATSNGLKQSVGTKTKRVKGKIHTSGKRVQNCNTSMKHKSYMGLIAEWFSKRMTNCMPHHPNY